MKKNCPDQFPRHWLERWHVDPSANRNYDFIDGLRGMAILMVVACHFIYFKEHASLPFRFLAGFLAALGLGVKLFFTLSGFLISWPFWKLRANRAGSAIPRGYGWRRFWKIYPPLALSILLLTPGFILSMGNAPLYFHTAIQWLTGAAFLTPVSGKLNPVMWSLVLEIHFYLVLPLLFLLTKPLSARTSLWVIPLLLLAVPETAHFLTGLNPTFAPEIGDPFFTGLSCFCLGVGLAGCDNLKLWSKNWGRVGDAGWLIITFALVGLAWSVLNPHAQTDKLRALLYWVCCWLFLVGSGCLLCYAADPQNLRARWLCTPWLRWFGIISYEWYLFHQPMITWSRQCFGHANGDVFRYITVLGVPLAASLLFSALVYKYFSLPILKYGRSKKSAGKG